MATANCDRPSQIYEETGLAYMNQGNIDEEVYENDDDLTYLKANTKQRQLPRKPAQNTQVTEVDYMNQGSAIANQYVVRMGSSSSNQTQPQTQPLMLSEEIRRPVQLPYDPNFLSRRKSWKKSPCKVALVVFAVLLVAAVILTESLLLFMKHANGNDCLKSVSLQQSSNHSGCCSKGQVAEYKARAEELEGLINKYNTKYLDQFLADWPKDPGDGWIDIQRRQLPFSMDMKRSWNDYVNGFEDEPEMWLGLQNVKQLTSAGNYTLRVEVITGDELAGYEVKHAEYAFIQLLGEYYELSVSKHSEGTLGNIFHCGSSTRFAHGHRFTTKDRDNDKHDINCAENYKSGWWHGNCFGTNLNTDKEYIFFLRYQDCNTKKFYSSIKATRMMIKKNT